VEVVPRIRGKGNGEDEEFEALKRSIRKEWSVDRKLQTIRSWCGTDDKRAERAGFREWSGAERWLLLNEERLKDTHDIPLT
jgi:hypothetical protein